jgi:hypothetical protein
MIQKLGPVLLLLGRLACLPALADGSKEPHLNEIVGYTLEDADRPLQSISGGGDLLRIVRPLLIPRRADQIIVMGDMKAGGAPAPDLVAVRYVYTDDPKGKSVRYTVFRGEEHVDGLSADELPLETKLYCRIVMAQPVSGDADLQFDSGARQKINQILFSNGDREVTMTFVQDKESKVPQIFKLACAAPKGTSLKDWTVGDFAGHFFPPQGHHTMGTALFDIWAKKNQHIPPMPE